MRLVKWIVVSVLLLLSTMGLQQVKGAGWLPSWPQAREWLGRWGRVQSEKAPSLGELKSEQEGVREQLKGLAEAKKEQAAVAARSESASRRVMEVLVKTQGDVLVLPADAPSSAVSRERIQLEAAIHTIAAASARVELGAIDEEIARLTAREKELRGLIERTAVRDAAKALTAALDSVKGSGADGTLVFNVGPSGTMVANVGPSGTMVANVRP